MINSTSSLQENKDLSAGLSARHAVEADNPRQAVIFAWQDWVADFAPWRSMLTLTVSNDHPCFKDGLFQRWRSLVQILNRDLYGNHYLRLVGHSYFSYVAGFEYTKNHVVHMHVIVDQPINFQLVHRVWNNMSGFAYIKPVTDKKGVANYLCKYVVKEQDLIFWKQQEVLKRPAFCPLWYLENLPAGHPHTQTLNKFLKRLF